MLHHLPALIALTCPSYNSYRRLQPRSWSTSYVCWGYDNRQAAVRAASPFWAREAGDEQYRDQAVDGSCNPYLALGAIIAAGLDGVDSSIDPGQPLAVDPSDLSDEECDERGIAAVPDSLRSALARVCAEPLVQGAHAGA